ncbi:MAG: MiaB/RimO family radical SAM methylthiotransferase [Thermotogae bacterium]|nr:MiaB/RimO family radical SAM methylthiotransferase [Thermotogota bacterium]
MGRKVFFKTFGCRTNQYDTEFLKSQMRRSGFSIVESPEEADTVIVNSCAVTHKAERESRREVRRHLRRGKEVIYTGCAAKVNPYEEAHLSGSMEDVLRHFGIETLSPIDTFTRARGILKVQEGCNFVCSYCIIRFARGSSRSIPLERILQDADNLSRITREITLTGTQIGDWGREWGKDLAYLLDVLTERYPDVRFRISSISPLDVSERLLKVMVERPNVCPHLHVSVQSGSDRVLRAMRRPYTRRLYEEKLRMIYSHIPDIAVGTDIIVGFPGETEEDFSQTLGLVEAYPFAYIHAFEYSPRPGTPAYTLREVPAPVRKRRIRRLQEVIASKRRAYRRRFIGKVLRAHVEKSEDGLLYGTTENYLKVAFEGNPALVGSIVPVRIVEDRDTGVLNARLLRL